MDDDLRYVIAGAVLGAILGALGGLVYIRFSRKPQAGLSDAVVRTAVSVDRGKALRLVWGVVGIIRQIVELG